MNFRAYKKSSRPYNKELSVIEHISGAQRSLYKTYKRGAVIRNYSFNLTFEYFVSLTILPCKCCGRENVNCIKSGNYEYHYNGIDRIDNTLGYEISNCQTLCGPCNFAKGTMTQQQFEEWIFAIAKYQNSK